jgi:hypothetical protein
VQVAVPVPNAAIENAPIEQVAFMLHEVVDIVFDGFAGWGIDATSHEWLDLDEVLGPIGAHGGGRAVLVDARPGGSVLVKIRKLLCQALYESIVGHIARQQRGQHPGLRQASHRDGRFGRLASAAHAQLTVALDHVDYTQVQVWT